jgi:hypothetical protein
MPFSREPLAPWLVVFAVTIGGCKGSGAGKSGAGTSGGAAEGSTKPAAAAAAPACRPGETRNDAPAFCYRLVAGMKRKGDPIVKKGRYQLQHEGDGGAKLSVIAWDRDAFDATWKALQSNAEGSKATDVKEVAVDANAKLLTYTTPGTDARHIVSFVKRGTKLTLECEAEVPKGSPVDALIAACKEVHDP